jgi:acylphosphatase
VTLHKPPHPAPDHRRTCYFSGRVQGVGFRYTAQNLALGYNVQGYVRNLPDGRVELVIEGPDQDMDRLVEAIKHKLSCFTRRTDVVESSATGEFGGFTIRH